MPRSRTAPSAGQLLRLLHELAMDNNNQPEAKAPSTVDRYQLGERLEAETKKLTGVVRQHFVDQRSLCSSCKHSTIRRQHSKNTRHIYCNSLGEVVPEDISECTIYAAVGSLSLSQMADIATLIDDRPDRYRGYL